MIEDDGLTPIMKVQWPKEQQFYSILPNRPELKDYEQYDIYRRVEIEGLILWAEEDMTKRDIMFTLMNGFLKSL